MSSEAASNESAVRQRGATKSRDGVVVSDKMDKTVVVAITALKKDKAYGKYTRKTDRYFAHDERNECGVGDMVRIVETRPLSKNKRWRVQTVLRKAL